MVKQWLFLPISAMVFTVLLLSCAPEPTALSKSVSVPQSNVNIIREPSVTPTPAVTIPLGEAVSTCIWEAAHTDELPTIPTDWVASTIAMRSLQGLGLQGLDTPEKLHDHAKFEVEDYDTLQAYIDAVPTPTQEVERSYELVLHYLYCKSLWQGHEATKVQGQNDAVSSVAECAWRMAHADSLPEVPNGVQNLTPAELKAEAEGLVNLTVSAYAVDTRIRAGLESGQITVPIVSNDWHLIFCGEKWLGSK